MRARSLLIAAVGVGLWAAGLWGCATDPSRGYSFEPTYASDVGTVSVPVFDNQTYSHGLEFQLTEALIKEIARSTPWRVVNPGEADTRLEGRIVSSELRTVTTKRGATLVQEQAVELTVDFDWVDNRTGETLASRRSFSTAETFAPAFPVQERIETGEFGSIQRMAEDIVASLRSNW